MVPGSHSIEHLVHLWSEENRWSDQNLQTDQQQPSDPIHNSTCCTHQAKEEDEDEEESWSPTDDTPHAAAASDVSIGTPFFCLCCCKDATDFEKSFPKKIYTNTILRSTTTPPSPHHHHHHHLLYQNKANQNLLKIKSKAKKSIWILLHLEDQVKNKTNPSAMYIHLEGSNPKQKNNHTINLITSWNCSGIFANKKTVSKSHQSLNLSKSQNTQTKQNKKNPQPSMLYNSFIIIIITIIKYKNNKNANKNTSRFTTKKHQTKHEFFAILVILVMWFWMGSFWLWFFFLNCFWGKNTCDETFSFSYNLNERKGIWKFESKLCM